MKEDEDDVFINEIIYYNHIDNKLIRQEMKFYSKALFTDHYFCIEKGFKSFEIEQSKLIDVMKLFYDITDYTKDDTKWNLTKMRNIHKRRKILERLRI